MNLEVNPLQVEVVPALTEWGPAVDSFGEVLLARCYLSMVTHRRGEVRCPESALQLAADVTKGIHFESWTWQDVITNAWDLEGEHVNILESQAYGAMLRWRLGRHYDMGSKFLHLVDSLVTSSAMAKGRSSSIRLPPVVARRIASVLPCQLHPTLGYVRSHLNASDAGFRKVKNRLPILKSVSKHGLLGSISPDVPRQST